MRKSRQIPYVSQMQRVIGKEKPECSQVDFDSISNAAKKEMCARCLFRLECFTDALNIELSPGSKPGNLYKPGFAAGLPGGVVLDIALKLHEADIRPVTIDMAEELMPPLVIQQDAQ